MLENFKSILLIFLIGLSIILSAGLWFRGDQYEIADEPVSQRIDFGSTPTTFQQIGPREVIFELNTEPEEGKDNHKSESEFFIWESTDEQYKKIWEIIKAELSEDIEEKNVSKKSVDKQARELKADNKLRLNFSFFPLGFYDSRFDANLSMEEEREDNNLVIEQLVFYLDESNNITGIFLSDYKNKKELDFNYDSKMLSDTLNEDLDFFTEGKLKRVVDFQEIISGIIEEMELTNLTPKDIKIETGEYNNILVPKEQREVSKKEFNYEKIDQEKLTKAFFRDLSFVRKIEEWDGAYFFTDGQRGLRFFPGGGFEYSSPYRESLLEDELMKERSYLEIINKSGEKFALYGGWNENLRLKSIDILSYNFEYEDSIYKMIYEYNHEGLPVINKDAFSLKFNSQELFSCVRKIPGEITPLELNEQAIEHERIVKKWIKEKILSKIENDFTDEKEFKEDYEELKFTMCGIEEGFYHKEIEGNKNKDLLVPVIYICSDADKYVYDALEGNLIEVIE